MVGILLRTIDYSNKKMKKMKKIDLTNQGLSELRISELQEISGGSKLSYYFGVVAHHLWNFFDCDSDREVQMSETLMNCI
jgi:hypothetical protein